MRAVWVDTNNDPDFVKAKAHGIDAFYFDMFDARVTPAYLRALVDQGYKVGVYMASNWWEFKGKTGAEIAKVVSDHLKKVFGKSLKPEFPRVQFDIEEHDPDKILSCLQEFRRLHKYQAVSWTMEGFQGGWMDPAFVDAVVDCNVRVVPQAYTGDMRNMAADQVYKDLLLRGFPENLITLFYDARDLDELIGWNGFAFTQGRLP